MNAGGAAVGTRPYEAFMQTCVDAEAVSKSIAHFVVNTAQLVVSLAAFVPLTRSIFAMKGSTLCSANLKPLLICLVVCFVMHLASSVATRLRYEVMYFVPSTNPCYYTVTGFEALVYCSPFMIGMIGFSLVHIAMCVERLIATCSLHSYERRSAALGLSLTAIVCVGVVALTLCVLHDTDLTARRSYLETVTPLNEKRFSLVVHSTFAVDIASTLLNGVLYYVNREQFKNKILDYNLSKSFQLHENRAVNRVLVPTTIVHSTILTVFLAIFIPSRWLSLNNDIVQRTIVYEMVQIIVGINGFVTPATFLWLSARTSVAADVRILNAQQGNIHYWQQFNTQIEVLPPRTFERKQPDGVARLSNSVRSKSSAKSVTFLHSS